MTHLPDKLQEVVEYFAGAPDEDTRAQMLIDFADGFRPVPERVARPPYPEVARVPHCESEAFVFAEPNPDGSLTFWFAVENPQGISAKAVSAILSRTCSGAALEQVAAVPPDVLHRIFGRNLGMGKGLGLMGIVEMVQAHARRQLKAARGPA
jgi:cysteine desulfuration protein SufE